MPSVRYLRRMRRLLFLLCLLPGFAALAQSAPSWYGDRAPGQPGTSQSPDGTQRNAASRRAQVRIFSSPMIDALLAEHQRANLEEGTVVGYRIQLFASPTLAETRAARSMFQQTFPGWEAEIVLEAPDFKLQVGAYADRFEAHKAWQVLIPEYPGSFLVKSLLPVHRL